MKRDIFIGGAWPYANYYLHVGHVAALLPGDIIARFFRASGDNVIYVSGSDCHGTPITQRAEKEGKTPEEIASFYDNEFRKTFKNLDFTYDEYSSTMDPYHSKYVQDKFIKLLENDNIYEKEENEDFCEKCNKFLSDRDIVGICPICGGKATGDQCDDCLASLESKNVLNKTCKTCGTPTIYKNNKHLYFKLSKFNEDIQNLINKNKNKWRNNAIGEAQKFVNLGLIDRAATRSLSWGIDVPLSGYEDKRIYVWIEAVLGYLSMGDKVAKRNNINFDEFINDNNKNLLTYFVHGKDNIPFHTVIFPALELGFNQNYRLPDYIISSCYVNLNNEKMSKSKGNLVTANELLEKFDSDTIRYYLTAYGPEKNDSNCSFEDIIQTHNKILVGGLGNFVNRNLSFINKKFEGVINKGNIDEKIKNKTIETYKLVAELIEKGELKTAINEVTNYVSIANKYYDENEPWNKVKEDISVFNDITYTCTYIIANLSNLFAPFIPQACLKIKNMLGLDENFTWNEIVLNEDIKINNLELLYERIDVE